MLLFFRQWLAERNLGLVPVARAAAFAWAGPWIARVQAADGEHAVVMFGSPSGALSDPADVLGKGAAIKGGWVLAPLDLHLGIERPYGVETQAGVVAAVLVAAEAEGPLQRVQAARALPGRGVEGDRYAVGRGTFSGGGRGYELTLIEAETLDELRLPWEQARRNVVTRGVSLNPLVGRRFRIGQVECVGRRLAEPCAHVENVSKVRLLRRLVHRGGLRADILVGGKIEVGAEVAPVGS